MLGCGSHGARTFRNCSSSPGHRVRIAAESTKYAFFNQTDLFSYRWRVPTNGLVRSTEGEPKRNWPAAACRTVRTISPDSLWVTTSSRPATTRLPSPATRASPCSCVRSGMIPGPPVKAGISRRGTPLPGARPTTDHRAGNVSVRHSSSARRRTTVQFRLLAAQSRRQCPFGEAIAEPKPSWDRVRNRFLAYSV